MPQSMLSEACLESLYYHVLHMNHVLIYTCHMYITHVLGVNLMWTPVRDLITISGTGTTSGHSALKDNSNLKQPYMNSINNNKYNYNNNSNNSLP